MMAIKVISGKPGSGKSYFALYKLITEFFEFCKVFFEWKVKTPVNIFTNIDGLKLPHESLDYHIKEAGGLLVFFTVDYQKQLMDRFPNIRYIIDESQKFFPRRFSDVDVLFFFQYHRHLGIDLYLITPDWGSVCPQITSLCEYEIRAVSDTLTLSKGMKYSFYAGFDKVGSTSLPADLKVFSLYKSFELPDQGKKIKPLQKYALQFALLSLVVFGSLITFWSSGFSGSGDPDTPVVTTSQSDPIVTTSRSLPVKNKEFVAGRATRLPPSQPTKLLPSYIDERLTVVEIGGVWVGDKLSNVYYNGRFYPVESFPYTILFGEKGSRVKILLPSDLLVASFD